MSDTRQAQVKAGTAFSYFTPLKPGVELQDSLDTGYEMVYSTLSDTYKTTAQEAWIGWASEETVNIRSVHWKFSTSLIQAQKL